MKPVIKQPVYFPVIPGNYTVEEAITAIFPRRGEHRENLFSLATRFPFGS